MSKLTEKEIEQIMTKARAACETDSETLKIVFLNDLLTFVKQL